MEIVKDRVIDFKALETITSVKFAEFVNSKMQELFDEASKGDAKNWIKNFGWNYIFPKIGVHISKDGDYVRVSMLYNDGNISDYYIEINWVKTANGLEHYQIERAPMNLVRSAMDLINKD